MGKKSLRSGGDRAAVRVCCSLFFALAAATSVTRALVLTSITVDGNMSDWTAVKADPFQFAMDGPAGGLIDRDAPVGFQSMECTIRLQAAPGADPEAVRRMLIEAEGRSIVLATLRRTLPIHIRIELPASAPVALAA